MSAGWRTSYFDLVVRVRVPARVCVCHVCVCEFVCVCHVCAWVSARYPASMSATLLPKLKFLAVGHPRARKNGKPQLGRANQPRPGDQRVARVLPGGGAPTPPDPAAGLRRPRTRRRPLRGWRGRQAPRGLARGARLAPQWRERARRLRPWQQWRRLGRGRPGHHADRGAALLPCRHLAGTGAPARHVASVRDPSSCTGILCASQCPPRPRPRPRPPPSRA